MRRMKSHRVVSLIEIPEELQIEILLKLPVKSILLCKCVCKGFRFIIENPNFVSTHLTRINHTNSQSLVLLNFARGIGWQPYDQLDYFLLSIDNKNTKEVLSCLPLTPPIPNISEFYRCLLVGTCNGLICVAVWFYNNNNNNRNADFMLLLWNPVIRQCRYLPKHQSECKPDVLEFGFVPETNDYVIVKIGYPIFHLEVYKMSTDSWTTIDCNLFAAAENFPTVYRVPNPVFLNGSFHWTIKNSKPNQTKNSIVYYKLKDEELGLMKMLDTDSSILDIVVDDYIEWTLSVIDERLAMICWNWEPGNIFEIWVMNDYGIGNSWTRLFKNFESFTNYLRPMGYWTNGLILLDKTNGSKRDFGREEVFFFYDLETRSMKKIPVLIRSLSITGFSSFVETLVPVR